MEWLTFGLLGFISFVQAQMLVIVDLKLRLSYSLSREMYLIFYMMFGYEGTGSSFSIVVKKNRPFYYKKSRIEVIISIYSFQQRIMMFLHYEEV